MREIEKIIRKRQLLWGCLVLKLDLICTNTPCSFTKSLALSLRWCRMMSFLVGNIYMGYYILCFVNITYKDVTSKVTIRIKIERNMAVPSRSILRRTRFPIPKYALLVISWFFISNNVILTSGASTLLSIRPSSETTSVIVCNWPLSKSSPLK